MREKRESREELIRRGMNAAIAAAQEYSSSLIGFDELFSEAVTALYEAADGYQAAGCGFMRYLDMRLKARLDGRYESLPGFLPMDYRVAVMHDRYEAALLELYPGCRAAEDECEVADFMGISVGELRAVKKEYGMCAVASLDEPVRLDDGEVPLVETIAHPATDNAAARYLEKLMDGLTDIEKYIVCAKNGVLSVMELPDGQIAKKLGISAGEVERIYNRSIGKIKKARCDM